MKMTGVSGAASLNWRARASAFSSSGRTWIWVLICSSKTLWHVFLSNRKYRRDRLTEQQLATLAELGYDWAA